MKDSDLKTTKPAPFELDLHDQGQLTINRDHVGTLQQHGLTTFRSLMDFSGGQIAKNVLRERTTTRLELDDGHGGLCCYYLKRHRRSSWREYIKPLLRLTRPILGARNEWEAILAFHRAGIPTMTPVAYGTSGNQSLLLTAALDACDCLANRLPEWEQPDSHTRIPRQILLDVAHTTRSMHGANLHHQDFYLYHLLVRREQTAGEIVVIDLGRARWLPRLGPRWIVKDLAQLNYSALRISRTDRLRFLRAYLNRRLTSRDRSLVRRIGRKTASIARHSSKHAL
ncbi:MAG: lipopolysaccharide kinase InaA family protein [Planctomycetaceae bacterium]